MMLCPRCRVGVFIGDPTKHRRCNKCGTIRRQIDRVVHRQDTNFFVLNRNVRRTPIDSAVELIEREGTHFEGIHGVLKFPDNGFLLRAVNSGAIIASSDDKDDLAILVVENQWRVNGPNGFSKVVEELYNDK